jgi:hypothetical protein
MRQLDPCVAGLPDQGFQRVAIAAGNELLELLQGLAKNGGLRQQLFAVGNKDVAPHFGVAGGNAGEIAKAGTGQGHVVFAIFLSGDAIDQGKRDQVGQMADGGISRIVRLG